MKNLIELHDDLDKSSDKWDGYFGVYEHHISSSFFELEKANNKDIVIVEVGVQNGGSLEMWSKFLSEWQIIMDGGSYTIYGIDVDKNCENLVYDDPNINVIIGDQASSEFWDDFLNKVPKIDIFIDDGGHFMEQQILTMEKVFPKLSVGGVYFCEDTHTSYMPYNGGGLHKKSTFIEYSKKIVDTLYSDWHRELDTENERKTKIYKDLTSINYYDSMVVLEKFGKRKLERVKPRKFNGIE